MFICIFVRIRKCPAITLWAGISRGERSYVIAPPSEIGKFRYSVAKDIAQLELGAQEVNQLLNYLQSGNGGTSGSDGFAG